MTGTAVRPGRGAIGENADYLCVNIWNVIRAGDGTPRVDRRNARPHAKRIHPDISNDACPEAGDPPIPPACEFGVLDLIASMGRREAAGERLQAMRKAAAALTKAMRKQEVKRCCWIPARGE